MTDNKTVLCEVQFDVTEAEAGMTTIGNLLGKLKDMGDSVGDMFSKVFNPDISTSIDNIADNLNLVTDKMAEIVELMKPQDESWLDGILGSIDTFNTLSDGMTNLEGISMSINKGLKKAAKSGEVFNIFKALIPDSYDLSGKISGKIPSILDSINSMFSDFATAASPKITALLTPIADGFAKISGTFSGLSSGWMLGIGVIIAGIILLITNWDTVMEVLGNVGEWVNTNIIQPVVGFLTNLWNSIVTVVTNIVNTVTQGFNQFLEIAQNVIGFVQNLFATFTGYLQNAFATDWTEQFGAFGHVLNAFFANIQNIWEAVKRIFNGVVDFVKSIFAGDWKAAWNSVIEIFGGIWDGMVAYIKMPINGIIGMINGLIRGVVDGLNAVIGLINSLSFDIPDWIPEIGGTTFGFNIQKLNAPQIPLLAQGAVLPANKPFLAMVGDQKHGTNVEAPLATIQEALANVLAQQGMGGDIHITFTGDLAQLGRGDLSVLGSIGWRKPGFPKADS